MNSLFDTNTEKESLPSIQRRVECTLSFPTSIRSSHFSYGQKTTISFGAYWTDSWWRERLDSLRNRLTHSWCLWSDQRTIPMFCEKQQPQALLSSPSRTTKSIQKASPDHQYLLQKKDSSRGQVEGSGIGKHAYSISWKENQDAQMDFWRLNSIFWDST